MALVFCLDDDEVVARLFAEIVTFCKHRALVLTDSMDAVERLRRDNPAAVLTDYMMPRLDGIELLNVVQETLPTCRRVLITAAPKEQAVREAEASGVVEMVIPKPPSIADIQKALLWLPRG